VIHVQPSFQHDFIVLKGVVSPAARKADQKVSKNG
jgi:hypothetical protein